MKLAKPIFIALIFCGILGLAVVKGFMSRRQESAPQFEKQKVEIARQAVNTFAERMAQIKKDCGAYPQSLEDLVGEGLCTKECPKVNCLKPGATMDVWGVPIQLSIESKMLVIRSLGHDGRPGGTGTAQDIEVSLPVD